MRVRLEAPPTNKNPRRFEDINTNHTASTMVRWLPAECGDYSAPITCIGIAEAIFILYLCASTHTNTITRLVCADVNATHKIRRVLIVGRLAVCDIALPTSCNRPFWRKDAQTSGQVRRDLDPIAPLLLVVQANSGSFFLIFINRKKQLLYVYYSFILHCDSFLCCFDLVRCWCCVLSKVAMRELKSHQTHTQYSIKLCSSLQYTFSRRQWFCVYCRRCSISRSWRLCLLSVECGTTACMYQCCWVWHNSAHVSMFICLQFSLVFGVDIRMFCFVQYVCLCSAS